MGYKIQYLTPIDYERIDPTGHGRAIVRAYPDTETWERPNPAFRDHDDLAECWKQRSTECVERRGAAKHQPYANAQAQAWLKFGRQGGSYTYSEMMDNILPYYQAADRSVTVTQVMRTGRDYLIRLVRQLVDKYGHPQWKKYVPINTFSALPACKKKNTFDGFSLGSGRWHHAYPIIPGQRRMRGKNRTIFMVSSQDLRYDAGYLDGIREWLRTYLPGYFASWCNPTLHLAPNLTQRLCGHSVVEIDYKSMDVNLTWGLVQEILLPVYEALQPDGFIGFAVWVEELYNAPLLTRDGIIEGLHSTFSGIHPTNDFETLWSVIQVIGASLLTLGYAPNYILGRRDKIQAFSLGDDQTILLKASKSFAEKFFNVLYENAGVTGMEIHPLTTKSHVGPSEEGIHFLQKVYYPAGPRTAESLCLGAYPTAHALRNILYPESLHNDPVEEAQACLARMDGCAYAPDFNPFVQFVYSHAVHHFQFTETQLKKAALSTGDWWARLYGEHWDPLTSPSWAIIRQSIENAAKQRKSSQL